jgi:hypothetical protein
MTRIKNIVTLESYGYGYYRVRLHFTANGVDYILEGDVNSFEDDFDNYIIYEEDDKGDLTETSFSITDIVAWEEFYAALNRYK